MIPIFVLPRYSLPSRYRRNYCCKLSSLFLVARKSDERARHRRRVASPSSSFVARLVSSPPQSRRSLVLALYLPTNWISNWKPPPSLVDSLFARGSDISPRPLSPTRRRRAAPRHVTSRRPPFTLRRSARSPKITEFPADEIKVKFLSIDDLFIYLFQ